MAAENCSPDFHVKHTSVLYRSATKADQAATSKGMVNKSIDTDTDPPYQLAILHNELSRLRASKEFVLNLVVIRRNGRENEG